MEVANFYSALTHTPRNASSQWLTYETSKNFVLQLPDGTALTVDVKVKDSSGLKSNDFIQVKVSLNDRLIEDGSAAQKDGARTKQNGAEGDEVDSGREKRPIARLLDPSHFPLTIQCQPPKPKYKTPDEEPDDNSPAMRASRCANAHIDLSRFSLLNGGEAGSAATAAKSQAEKILATIWVQLYVIISLLPTEEAFNIVLGDRSASPAVDLLIGAGLAVKHPLHVQDPELTSSMVLCTRAAFWQTLYPFKQSPWLLNEATGGSISSGLSFPASYTFSHNAYHPKRPVKPTPADGPLYKRHILELGQTLTFEVASSKDDEVVKKFTQWHNSERVSSGWRQRGSEEDQRKYLEQVEKTEGSLGLIGKWDGIPFGYFEIYWVKESNISPYYSCDDYDRGFHALVGEEKFRGAHRVRTWMGSLFHLIFLLDFRTQRAVLEPRASNHKMINYAQMCGGHVEKLIDLPHKRAALVICPREGYFQLCPLGPLPKQ